MIKLYMKDNTGAIRIWSIEKKQYGLRVSHGVLGGSLQYKDEHIYEGLASRTVDQQIQLRISSRINKQKDKGYIEDLELASSRTNATNTLGLLKPMLAQRFDKVKDVDLVNSYLQPKLNGHRCLITKQNGAITAYSRNGKPITSISHILSDIIIAEGDTLDGELYCHGVHLQTIGSWIKKSQSNTRRLKYVVYDIIKNVDYAQRLELLRQGHYTSNVELIETRLTSNVKSIKGALTKSIANGFEGLIIRQGDHGYEDGKRSKSLIKVKKCFDDEFLVIDILESKDGWARLVLELPNGGTVMCSAPGTIADKTNVWLNRDDYIGKWVQLEYFELTKDDVPFHPTATMWRNKEEE